MSTNRRRRRVIKQDKTYQLARATRIKSERCQVRIPCISKGHTIKYALILGFKSNNKILCTRREEEISPLKKPYLKSASTFTFTPLRKYLSPKTISV